MAKVIQSGNSFALTIPKKFAKMMGISIGDDVKIEKRPQRGQLIFNFTGPRQLELTEKLVKLKK